MIEKCKRCGSNDLFVEIKKSNIRGLYCGNCGLWLKWITKQELQVAKYKKYKIIEE